MPLFSSGPLSQRGDLLVMEPGEMGGSGGKDLELQANSQKTGGEEVELPARGCRASFPGAELS